MSEKFITNNWLGNPNPLTKPPAPTQFQKDPDQIPEHAKNSGPQGSVTCNQSVTLEGVTRLLRGASGQIRYSVTGFPG